MLFELFRIFLYMVMAAAIGIVVALVIAGILFALTSL